MVCDSSVFIEYKVKVPFEYLAGFELTSYLFCLVLSSLSTIFLLFMGLLDKFLWGRLHVDMILLYAYFDPCSCWKCKANQQLTPPTLSMIISFLFSSIIVCLQIDLIILILLPAILILGPINTFSLN